jgi:hypothetical protein
VLNLLKDLYCPKNSRSVELVDILAIDIAGVSSDCEGASVNGWTGHTSKSSSVGVP